MIKLDLSELPISPQQYRIMGIVMMSAGVLLLILGIVLAVMTEGRRSAHANRVKISAEDCGKKISALGLAPEIAGETIRLANPELARGMELLGASSQIAALCPNWTMTSYCLGEACSPRGLSMTLQYGEKK